jgi:hypothetical protein
VRGGKGGGGGGGSSSDSGEEEDASGYEAYDARFRVLLDHKGLAKPRYKVCVITCQITIHAQHMTYYSVKRDLL